MLTNIQSYMSREKKESKQLRCSMESWRILRKLAYERNKTIIQTLDDILQECLERIQKGDS